MAEFMGLDVAARRRRRGVAKASITKLVDRVLELERKPKLTNTDRLTAQRLQQRLTDLDGEFKRYHLSIVDVLENEEEQTREQAVIDDHDNKVTELFTRIARLTTEEEREEEVKSDPQIYLRKRLQHLERNLRTVATAVSSAVERPPVDRCLLEQYDEQLNGFRLEVFDVTRSILSLDGDVSELSESEANISKVIFDTCLQIRRSLQMPVSIAPMEGIKLPKIDVPTFNGDIMNWRNFWEQYEVSIHSRTHLSDPEKLTYLRQSLKDSPARHVIEGLSGSGSDYEEAIKCLQNRYDKPRLLHQAHVRAILEAPIVKDGSGKELRRLHDVCSQHLRALKAMKYDPSGAFVTSLIETKFDPTTMFEWQRHSQKEADMPHYMQILEFIDLRARASETTLREVQKRHSSIAPARTNIMRTTYVTGVDTSCVICGGSKHPVYACRKFKLMSTEQRTDVAKSHQLCFNCLRPGHFRPQCTSEQTCLKCRKSHHSLLHREFDRGIKASDRTSRSITPSSSAEADESSAQHNSHLSHPEHRQRSALLMTCQVAIMTSDGGMTKARALLDCASSTSFVTERLAQRLQLPRRRQRTQVAGIGGIEQALSSCSVVNFTVANLRSLEIGKLSGPRWKVEAVVLPKITTKLPLLPITFNDKWKHLAGIHLADPEYGVPGHVDILLGVDIFSRAVRQGRRVGPPGSPMALNTCFGWVLSGSIGYEYPRQQAISCFSSALTGDELLQKFWEVENCNFQSPSYSLEEQAVVDHFHANHSRDKEGRFVVPLPRKSGVDPLGETRSMAVRRFLSLERSLRSKGNFHSFDDVINEYFQKKHAEPVPSKDLTKNHKEVFYLPMHAVYKDSSSTSKLRVVFDASAKSSSGVSLNDQLLVGPTVHAPLIDVLLRFRRHRIAMSTDISRMYRAILLPESQRDLHRFCWRRNEREPLKDYRMTRLTFGVSASSFAANMAVKQNAIIHERSHPRAAKTVRDCFYVDDGLFGAGSLSEATELQEEVQDLFDKGGFLLRKWKSNEPEALCHLPPHLVDTRSAHDLPTDSEYTKVLGIEWNTETDSLRLTAGVFTSERTLTKRALASNVAKIYDILGWYSPTVIKLKILLQQLWLTKLGWDELIPSPIQHSWEKWQGEFPLLTEKQIPRYYYQGTTQIVSVQLHGFSDASELAYGGVVYLRATDSNEAVCISLVTAKTRVAPIKTISLPRLELCGAVVMAKLLDHCRKLLDIPLNNVWAWTDSTIVLSWLQGNPRRFKPFVGNRVAEVMELVPPDRWQHIPGIDNPADCASRGLYPSELVRHSTWWNGPPWLHESSSEWPKLPELKEKPEPCEEKASFSDSLEVGLTTTIDELPLLGKISSYTRLRRITAWMRRFCNNCRASSREEPSTTGGLTSAELYAAEGLWLSIVQRTTFPDEINILRMGKQVTGGPLLALHPFLDSNGLMRVGGRLAHSTEPYAKQHPVIIQGKNALTKLIIRTEHYRLLHAGPTLVAASLARRFAIIGARKVIRDVTRSCVICRRVSGKTCSQLLGQLPSDRLKSGPVFDRVGVDYAGPVLVKSGYTRRPTITKAYVCVFVAFATKAVHLEPVSDLTTTAFIATLRRFIARRGKPTVIWSDHGTNFVGAANELKELHEFWRHQSTKNSIADFYSGQGILWRFTPEHAPHFGGLWEAAVKSFKYHLRRIVGDVRLTFEELATTLSQIEACLNSRPLIPLPSIEEGMEALTPGHFLIGRPLEALPDPPSSFRPISLLRRWNLCQTLTRHMWKRWSAEYLVQLQRLGKWRHESRNLKVGDIVCVRGEHCAPTKWPMAKIKEIIKGEDGLVRVVVIQTSKGIYKRPITKIVPLLSEED